MLSRGVCGCVLYWGHHSGVAGAQAVEGTLLGGTSGAGVARSPGLSKAVNSAVNSARVPVPCSYPHGQGGSVGMYTLVCASPSDPREQSCSSSRTVSFIL